MIYEIKIKNKKQKNIFVIYLKNKTKKGRKNTIDKDKFKSLMINTWRKQKPTQPVTYYKQERMEE